MGSLFFAMAGLARLAEVLLYVGLALALTRDRAVRPHAALRRAAPPSAG